jgi:hypothetical protein
VTVTHIRYDEQTFRSGEECLAEIAWRLEHGWFLSQISASAGRVRAVFGWQTTADDPTGSHSRALAGSL